MRWHVRIKIGTFGSFLYLLNLICKQGTIKAVEFAFCWNIHSFDFFRTLILAILFLGIFFVCHICEYRGVSN